MPVSIQRQVEVHDQHTVSLNGVDVDNEFILHCMSRLNRWYKLWSYIISGVIAGH